MAKHALLLLVSLIAAGAVMTVIEAKGRFYLTEPELEPDGIHLTLPDCVSKDCNQEGKCDDERCTCTKEFDESDKDPYCVPNHGSSNLSVVGYTNDEPDNPPGIEDEADGPDGTDDSSTQSSGTNDGTRD